MSAERDALHRRMAQAVLIHCERDDMTLIAAMMMQYPQRMTEMLNARAGELFTDHSFAMFCLQCAKRIRAGGPA